MQSFNLRTVLAGSVATVLLATTGCGPASGVNPFAIRRENEQLKSAVRNYQTQLAQTKIERDNLDADNEKLQSLLAEQEGDRMRAETESKKLAMTPPKLQLAPADDEDKDYGPARSRAPSAAKGMAMNKKGATDGWLPMTTVQGAEVVRDGDTVRIRVTNTSLFDPGKATLKPGATQVLDRVASAIRRDYPGLLVGIEGHTDSDPIRKSNWKDNHELSVERAMAVYEYLKTKSGISADQLFVAGYGSNVPVASNKSAAGKAQNRRVEFVVHPIEARVANDRTSRR